jgi:hydroxypyruvate reductase 1
MLGKEWITYNSPGTRRVIVTKQLPGDRWLEVLRGADCRVDICTSEEVLKSGEIEAAIGGRCDGAIGQLTELWGKNLFAALQRAGGKVYSNYAVGYNNVDVAAATEAGIAVGNTPGVLTETTAEMAVGLTFAAARHMIEADKYTRSGRFKGWLPALFLGDLLWRKTVGVIGMGRIGAAYARMMAEGHKMDVIYYNPHPRRGFEEYISAYSVFLHEQGEEGVGCRRAETVDEVLREADVVSLHTVLNDTTYHLINRERLAMMKENAILVNSSRGPLIDEAALVDHCRQHPNFRAALDVFEEEPDMKHGLKDLDNVVVLPHIGSATGWTRQGMATLAAANVAAVLLGYPAWHDEDTSPFLGDDPPKAAPSIVNAKKLNI